MFKCDILRCFQSGAVVETQWNAAEFLGLILHHTNSFSML